jgi:serine protease Do
MRTHTKVIAGTMVGLVAGAALALTLDQPATSSIGEGPGAAGVTSALPPIDTTPMQRAVPTGAGQVSASYAPIVKQAAPAVVNIYTATIQRQRPNPLMNDPFFKQFFGQAQPQPRVQQSLGSGVIVAKDGYVITNNHVVKDADQILVALADRREYKAELVFADARLDLALLKIKPEGDSLPVIRMGDSDRAEVGDITIAIGNPFGVGQTVTTGIVSAVARTGLGVSDWQFFIQTDAAINPGNSGGALLDAQGRLIGVNTAIYSRSGGSQGIGFAIPSKMVRVFLAAADTGKLVSGWIGLEGEPLTAQTARAAGLDRPGGLLVTGVAPRGPAAAAGIQIGDILRSVDDKQVADGGQLRYSLATEGVGKVLKVDLLRNGEARRVDVTLASPPEVPLRQLTPITGRGILSGVTIANLSPAYAQELGAGLPEKGVVVVEIAGGAPAARLGYLRPGDIIETLNGETVRAVADVTERLDAPRIGINRSGQRAECGITSRGGFNCRS